MKNMKASVIVPTFNRAEMLGAALASIRKQNYQNIEVIVVDDGSNDETADIVAEHTDYFRQTHGENTLLYVHQKNSGAPTARNRGLAHASGDYLLFMDSDDLLAKEGLAAVMARFKQCDAEFLHGKVSEVDGMGGALGREAIGGEYEETGDGLMNYSWHTMGAVYSRACIERVGLWATALTGSQDWEYQVRVKLFGGKGEFIDTVLGYWRQHDTQRLGTKTLRPEYVKSVQEACRLIIANAEKANRCDGVLRMRVAKRLLVHAAEWGAHGFTSDKAECLELAENISQHRLSVALACSMLRISPRWCARIATSVLAARRGTAS
jgi:glycosyltransferase involved in cell wall biosynthesis